MQIPISFERLYEEPQSGKVLWDLEMRLRHIVFGEASVSIEIDKRTNLPVSVTAASRYGHYYLRVEYSASGKTVKVNGEIKDTAPSDVKTAMTNVLLELFKYELGR